MTKAPVWDMELGFGGDGNASDVESVAYGHCVTDGPFGRLELMNYGQETKPHCLSRGFLDDANARGELGKAVGPEALEGLLRKDDYSEFNLGLEMGAHNSVPFVVRGDFYKFTAPNGKRPERAYIKLCAVVHGDSRLIEGRPGFLPSSCATR